ncbi:hypothetical protein Esti_001004 [Eimeria stiedai]
MQRAFGALPFRAHARPLLQRRRSLLPFQPLTFVHARPLAATAAEQHNAAAAAAPAGRCSPSKDQAELEAERAAAKEVGFQATPAAPPDASSSSSSSNSSSKRNSSSNSSSSKDSCGSSSKGWFEWTWPRALGTISALSVGAWFVKELSDSGFNFGKAEWVISAKVKRLLLGGDWERTSRAAPDSRFEVGLSQELQNELALYFIQLDLDKPNGVRRSDALALVEQLGFSARSQICADFVRKGKGKPIPQLALRGFCMQEAGELLEALLLHEEANPTPPSASHQKQEEEQQQQQQRQQPERNGMEGELHAAAAAAAADADADAVAPCSLPGERPQARVLRLLREANRRASPTAWTVPPVDSVLRVLSKQQQQHQEQQQQQQQQQQEGGEGDGEAREALELRLTAIDRLLQDFTSLDARRGLGEAEKKRRETLKAERKELQRKLRDMLYAS